MSTNLLKKNNAYRLIATVLAVLALFNLIYFLLKSTQIFETRTQRQTSHVQHFAAKHFSKGDRVVADPLYFYAVTAQGAAFRYLDLYGEDSLREAYHRQIFDYHYLLVSAQVAAQKPQAVAVYFRHARLELIDSVSVMPPDTWLNRILSSAEQSGYNGKLYRRIR